MTESTVSLLERLHKEATPGEWRCRTNAHRETCGEPWGWVNSKDNSAQLYTWSGSRNRKHAADNALIVAMRNALPLLLDVVEAARLCATGDRPVARSALRKALQRLSALNETE